MGLDRRRNPEYGNFSGYIPKTLIETAKKIMEARGINQNEALEQAIAMWTADWSSAAPQTISELVARNLPQLQEAGLDVISLNTIAQGKVLPTKVDFCAIIAALELSKEEKEFFWNQTYGESNCNNGKPVKSRKPV